MPADVETEHSPCPLCGRTDGPEVVRGGDRELGLPGEFRVIRCPGCRLMRTDPRPTLETMGFYYPDAYAPYELQSSAVQARPASSRVRSCARRVLDARDHALPPMAPGRLLELGCASGQFLEAMAGSGWEVRGIEPSAAATARARARGLEVENVQVENAPRPEARFDLIAAWMVVEHLHHPIQVLARIKEWVTPSGWLALSVPNAASLERRIFGRHWYALQLPRHLFHFEPRTLTDLLAAAGWQVVHIFQQRTTTNLVGSCGRALEDTPWPAAGRYLGDAASRSSLLRVATFPASIALSALGQTGRMTVWARPAP